MHIERRRLKNRRRAGPRFEIRVPPAAGADGVVREFEIHEFYVSLRQVLIRQYPRDTTRGLRGKHISMRYLPFSIFDPPLLPLRDGAHLLESDAGDLQRV